MHIFWTIFAAENSGYVVGACSILCYAMDKKFSRKIQVSELLQGDNGTMEFSRPALAPRRNPCIPGKNPRFTLL
jgi:hypothetical protein